MSRDLSYAPSGAQGRCVPLGGGQAVQHRGQLPAFGRDRGGDVHGCALSWSAVEERVSGSQARDRRALLAAARLIVARDGHRARLEEIAEQAEMTTGAVYSLFGSKNGLLVALVTDYLGLP
ncbi:TetR/AcrR family transcriptional regulator [Nonomuraea sp. NPDC001699]